MNPYQVRLVVRRKEDKAKKKAKKGDLPPPAFEARWVELDGQSSEPFDLVPPLSSDDAADLRWYLEKYHEFVGDGTRAKAARIEGQLEGWGKALFKAAFGTTEGIHVYRNLEQAERSGRPILLTLGTEEPLVLLQPWELMRDHRGPLAFHGVSIRRQLQGSQPFVPKELRLPLRLLMIVARPSGAGFIDPRTSVRPLLDGLDALPKGSVEVTFCEPPTMKELNRRVAAARRERRPFHIVHFDGHGTYLQDQGVGALCFEDAAREVDLVPARRFGDLIARVDVPLVILEACRTSDLSDRPVFGSLAPALIARGVGSVLAYSHSIHIEASRILVESFYRELAQGLTVGQAVSEARTDLNAEPKRWLALGPNPPTVNLQDWFVPQLYQVGPDLALVADDAEVPEGADAVLVPSVEERMHGFPQAPQYGFQGRARELLDLERAFEKHMGVLLAGGGGMGKTALAREAAAWWLRTGRFEQAVFCSFEQVRSAERAVQILGQAFEGVDFLKRPAESQEAAAVALFRERKVLLVWDNFESTLPHFQDGETGGGLLAISDEERGRLRAFYQALTNGRPAGRVLVTCRPGETGLPRIKRIGLEGLARYDSLHLVTSIADLEDFDLEREGLDREDIEKVLDDLQDHPLSISLVAPHLATLRPAAIRRDFGALLGQFTNAGAEVDRNKSLLASLKFSTSRLSEAAQAVLPYLAWFQGGAFEMSIRGFTGLEAEQWLPVRVELESTALVRVEPMAMFNNPFVRFHPTLPFAANAADVPDVDAAEQRFLAVYRGVSAEVDGALEGQGAQAGMILMALEEANARAAIGRAFLRGERQIGWHIADTLRIFLEMAGRRRERDALAAWVRENTPDDAGLDEAGCAAIRSHAQALFAAGRLDEAVAALETLAARLEREGLVDGRDVGFQVGTTYQVLGQILVSARQPNRAVAASQRAIEVLETVEGDAAKGNLSGALGDLANAHRHLGNHAEALAASERGVSIVEDVGRWRNAAAGHGRSAAILLDMRRFAEAEARYEKALALARQVGDLELQASLLQHQGVLSRKQDAFETAAARFQQAVGLFQQAGNRGGEMRTYDLLGTTEVGRGDLDAAEAWYGRSRALAELLGDRYHLGVIAQNVGILHQTRAEQTADPGERERLLRLAVASIEESLAIKLERSNDVGAASSYSQLGVLHRLLGDLDQAETDHRHALTVRERLGLPEVLGDYHGLAEVADARGDADAAASWRAKRDAKLAEVRALERGGGPDVLPEQVTQAFLGLAQAVFAARTSGNEVPVELAEILAQLTAQPEPLASAGAFLRAFADGDTPTVPDGLPEPLPKIFAGLLASLDG